MDAVAGLLDGPARGRLPAALAPRPAVVDAHRGRGALTLVPVVRGSAWIGMDAGEAPAKPDWRRTSPRETSRSCAGHATTPWPTPRDAAADGERRRRAVPVDRGLALSLAELGVRTWGNDPDGPTVLLTGTYPSTARWAAAC
ncbi:hypothetical protein NKG05_01590 [Oerskovia sp. M15]